MQCHRTLNPLFLIFLLVLAGCIPPTKGRVLIGGQPIETNGGGYRMDVGLILDRQGLVGGLRTEPVLISQDRTLRGIHLELHPFGVRTLLGVSAAELSGRVVGLDDLGWPALAELPDRLASRLTWSERFDIIDDVLAAKASEPRSVAAELGEAWRLMLRTGGRVPIADLADEIGWSRRHFAERFRGEIGLAPKQAARILRFERAGGICQGCGRPHGATIRCLPDGRWFDAIGHTWRNRRGRPARWPDLVETAQIRQTRVILAAAHLDHDPRNNRVRNLKSLCQRCHMINDRPHHLAQRRITYLLRRALGDLFLGPYSAWLVQQPARFPGRPNSTQGAIHSSGMA